MAEPRGPYVPGPPPPARGRRAEVSILGRSPGTTPASAGTTTPASGSWTGWPDHPRQRGDDVPGDYWDELQPGPPPPARGRPGVPPPRGHLPGTTPASAGTTSTTTTHLRAAPDHPRQRGDDLAVKSIRGAREGPPPPARGRRRGPRPGAPGRGTTPASAGTTGSSTSTRRSRGDHPRQRGDDSCGRRLDGHGCGPPPPARGRHLLTRHATPDHPALDSPSSAFTDHETAAAYSRCSTRGSAPRPTRSRSHPLRWAAASV